jgi:hypothetical protein
MSLTTEVIAERALERPTCAGLHTVTVRIYKPVRWEHERWVSKLEILDLPEVGDVEQFPAIGDDAVAALVGALQLAGARLERHDGLRWGPMKPWYPIGYASFEDAILR